MPTTLRAMTATVLALFFGASTGGGYCPMAAAASALSDRGVTPHDCCKTGLSGKVPSCCHAGNTSTHIAVVKSNSVMALPTVSAAVLILSYPVQGPGVTSTRLARLPHGPPLTVLRV